MTVLVGVSDEFLGWLNACPTQWFLMEQKNESLVYEFMKGETE